MPRRKEARKLGSKEAKKPVALENEEVLERWRVGLSKVQVLYRAHDGRLWGMPQLGKGKTPEDSIVRKPLNVRAWLIARLGQMFREDFGPSGEMERKADDFWLCVQGAIETLIGESRDEVVRHAVQRFHAFELDAVMPEFDEFYPRNWIQLQDESRTTDWLSNPEQRDMTELFLREVRFGIPRESRRWTTLDGSGRKGE